jgi:hypothetical protein
MQTLPITGIFKNDRKPKEFFEDCNLNEIIKDVLRFDEELQEKKVVVEITDFVALT